MVGKARWIYVKIGSRKNNILIRVENSFYRRSFLIYFACQKRVHQWKWFQIGTNQHAATKFADNDLD